MKTLAKFVFALLIPLAAAGCSLLSNLTPEGPVLNIHKHSAWSDIAPKGVEANGLRRNLAVDDSVTFENVTIAVTDMQEAETEEDSEKVTISLTSPGNHDTMTLDEGDAINWNGYHISVVAIYAKKGDLGYNSTVFEIATIDSLPEEIAQSGSANGPEYRLRVKHDIDKLTLHHSATPLTPEDDLGQKMKNMQIWGENDRNWWDVPYHFIIDLDGSILEARDYHYAGDTNTRYDTAGHFLINCYGNYSEAEPNQQQLQAIANLMAWAAAEFEIDPIVIYGHRDLAQTGCPGDNLYRYVEDGTLKQMVEDALEKGQPKLVWLDEMEQPQP